MNDENRLTQISLEAVARWDGADAWKLVDIFQELSEGDEELAARAMLVSLASHITALRKRHQPTTADPQDALDLLPETNAELRQLLD